MNKRSITTKKKLYVTTGRTTKISTVDHTTERTSKFATSDHLKDQTMSVSTDQRINYMMQTTARIKNIKTAKISTITEGISTEISTKQISRESTVENLTKEAPSTSPDSKQMTDKVTKSSILTSPKITSSESLKLSTEDIQTRYVESNRKTENLSTVSIQTEQKISSPKEISTTEPSSMKTKKIDLSSMMNSVRVISLKYPLKSTHTMDKLTKDTYVNVGTSVTPKTIENTLSVEQSSIQKDLSTTEVPWSIATSTADIKLTTNKDLLHKKFDEIVQPQDGITSDEYEPIEAAAGPIIFAFCVLFLSIEIIFFLVMDLSTFKKNLLKLRRNCKS